jgi:hypothetical protein
LEPPRATAPGQLDWDAIEKTVLELDLFVGALFHILGSVVVIIHVVNSVKELFEPFKITAFYALPVLLSLPSCEYISVRCRFSQKEVLFAVGFRHSEGVIGIEGLRIFQEVEKTVINNCHNPLEVVYWGTLVPSEAQQEVLQIGEHHLAVKIKLCIEALISFHSFESMLKGIDL